MGGSAEPAALERLLAADPELARACRRQDVRAVFKGGGLTGLDRRLEEAERTNLPAFESLACGTWADRATVDGARTRKRSAGPTEGRVGKITLQQGLGFDRAAFALVRQRVLAAGQRGSGDGPAPLEDARAR
jgi:transposase